MDMIIKFLVAAVGAGTPLLFGTVGEILTEKTGHLNLGVEGMMSIGACAGFMVGSPNQTLETIADDLVFLQELQPEMVGIGPFIPHHDTCFAKEPAGSVDFSLFLLSVIRIMLPGVLLPATTALGTMDENGREKGIRHGANVIMPNLSPLKNRKQYELYDNKICTGEEAAEGLKDLEKRVESVDCRISYERGDFVK